MAPSNGSGRTSSPLEDSDDDFMSPPASDGRPAARRLAGGGARGAPAPVLSRPRGRSTTATRTSTGGAARASGGSQAPIIGGRQQQMVARARRGAASTAGHAYRVGRPQQASPNARTIEISSDDDEEGDDVLDSEDDDEEEDEMEVDDSLRDFIVHDLPTAPYELSFLDQQQKWESEEDATTVAAALLAHPEVTSFVLRGNSLGVGAGERIAQALEQCPNLKDCNWSDLFTGRLRSEIPIIVKRLCAAMISAGVQLRSLDLSDNAFGPIGAKSIKEFLKSDSAFSLEELRLNNCGLGAGAITVANSLLTLHRRAVAAGRKLNLKVIVAGRNRLRNLGAYAFAKAIGEIGTLEVLTVHQNEIDTGGIIYLSAGVARNPRMTRLSIADNDGGWAGALAFAGSLANLRELELADFSDCRSNNAGCRAIVEAAVRLPKLKSLNLSGSELTADVAGELVTVWSQGRNDQAILNISKNNLADAFGDIRELAAQLGQRVDVGESDDDCGSLSGLETDDDDEEEESASDGELYGDLYSEDSEDDEDEEDEDAVRRVFVSIPDDSSSDEEEDEDEEESSEDDEEEAAAPPPRAPARIVRHFHINEEGSVREESSDDDDSSEDEMSETEREQRVVEDKQRATSPSTALLGECTICHEDDVVEPTMCKNCKNIVGCYICVARWMRAAHEPHCPLCREKWTENADRAIAMRLQY